MYVKQNDSGAYTDGVLKYGNVSSDTSQYGSGIRFSKVLLTVQFMLPIKMVILGQVISLRINYMEI